MSRRLVLTLAAAASLLAAAPALADGGTPSAPPAAAPASAPSAPAETAALQLKVADLERRIQATEARLAEAERHRMRVVRPDSHADSQ